MAMTTEKRLDRDSLFMEMAILVSLRGTCSRRQVGAVIVRDNRVVSMGYNGTPPGMPHCVHTPQDTVCDEAIHAEANAIAWAARAGVPTFGATMYAKASPCLACAQLLISSGIMRVVYAEEYRLMTGLVLLEQAKVEVEKWTVGESSFGT